MPCTPTLIECKSSYCECDDIARAHCSALLTDKGHYTMNFANLHPSFRTLLAALGNADGLPTDVLSRCVNATPAQAASELCAMRKLGLIYSRQRTPNSSYCKWFITDFGRDVFEGRKKDKHQITKFAVVTNFDTGVTGTKEQALLAAEEMALRLGKRVTVLGLCADVIPPVQPEVQIQLL